MNNNQIENENVSIFDKIRFYLINSKNQNVRKIFFYLVNNKKLINCKRLKNY